VITLVRPNGEPATDNWEQRSACRREDPNLFFPISYDSIEGALQVEEARAVCYRCPVAQACLTAIMEREGGKNATYRHGVWAGTTPSQRYYMVHKRRPSQQAKRKQVAA
jgi:WhiB family redox-sensing transcriptional regulator